MGIEVKREAVPQPSNIGFNTFAATPTMMSNNAMPFINFNSNLPPIHQLPAFSMQQQHIPLTMSSVNTGQSDEQSTASQTTMFPMNVTPSVSMMGGPPLASM